MKESTGKMRKQKEFQVLVRSRKGERGAMPKWLMAVHWNSQWLSCSDWVTVYMWSNKQTNKQIVLHSSRDPLQQLCTCTHVTIGWLPRRQKWRRNSKSQNKSPTSSISPATSNWKASLFTETTSIINQPSHPAGNHLFLLCSGSNWRSDLTCSKSLVHM